MNQTSTRETITMADILSMFDPMPRGATLIGAYELKCEQCGEIYFERSYVGLDRYTHTEKKACGCERPYLEKMDYERQLREKREKLQAECDYYFAKYDMLQDHDYDKYDLSKFDTQEHPSRADSYRALNKFTVGEEYNSLCFYGAPGRGKSFLAVGFAREQKPKGYSVLAIKCPVLLNRIKQTYGLQDESAERDIIRILQTLDLLVIDEVGIENATSWALEKLYLIIDYRHDHHKSSIYTTNLTGKEMEDREGAALRSRIMGAGGPGAKYLIEGRDRRVA